MAVYLLHRCWKLLSPAQLMLTSADRINPLPPGGAPVRRGFTLDRS